MKPKSVGLRELKTHISEYIAEVREGKSLDITVRGEMVGRIIPLRAKSEDLTVEAGDAYWSGKKFAPSIKPAVPHGKKTVTEILLDNRK